MDRLSLRVRATLMGIAVTAIVVSLASVVLTVTLERQLTSAGDDLAQSRVRDLMSAAERGDLPTDGQLRNVNDESLAQVVGPDGDVVAASPNIAGSPAVVGASALGVAEDQLVVATLDAPDDDETERYRIWVGRGPSPEGDVTVLVGTSLESVAEASTALRRSLLIGVPLVLGLLALAIWTVLGAALRARRPDHQDRRHHRRGGAVASGRGERRRRRGRSPRADHEPDARPARERRSPPTCVRGRCVPRPSEPPDRDARRPRGALAHPEQVQTSALAHDLLAASSQMEDVVSDLLHLAVEDDAPHPEPALLDLDAIVLEEVARVRAGSSATLDVHAVSAAPCSATARRCVGWCATCSTTPYGMPTRASRWRSRPMPTTRSCSTYVLEGDVPSPADPPSGCRFHTRCRYATEVCRTTEPPLAPHRDGHLAACHHPRNV